MWVRFLKLRVRVGYGLHSHGYGLGTGSILENFTGTDRFRYGLMDHGSGSVRFDDLLPVQGSGMHQVFFIEGWTICGGLE